MHQDDYETPREGPIEDDLSKLIEQSLEEVRKNLELSRAIEKLKKTTALKEGETDKERVVVGQIIRTEQGTPVELKLKVATKNLNIMPPDFVKGRLVGIDMKRASIKYVNEFLKLRCAPDMLPTRLFDDFIDVSQSFAAFNAVRHYLQETFPFDDRNIKVFCVEGSGIPITAATFAFRTHWQCIGICEAPLDPSEYPALDVEGYRVSIENEPVKWHGFNIQRLGMVPASIHQIDPIKIKEKCIIIVVNDDVNIKKLLSTIQPQNEAALVTVSINCMIAFPKVEFRDWGIWSTDNLVGIWDLEEHYARISS